MWEGHESHWTQPSFSILITFTKPFFFLRKSHIIYTEQKLRSKQLMEAKCVSQILSIFLFLFKGKEFLPYMCYLGNVPNISEIPKNYQCIFSFLIPCSDNHPHWELKGISKNFSGQALIWRKQKLSLKNGVTQGYRHEKDSVI